MQRALDQPSPTFALYPSTREAFKLLWNHEPYTIEQQQWYAKLDELKRSDLAHYQRVKKMLDDNFKGLRRGMFAQDLLAKGFRVPGTEQQQPEQT